MKTFTCILTDHGDPTPEVCLLMAADETRARELAVRKLDSDAQHQRVELRDGSRVVFSEERSWSPPEAPPEADAAPRRGFLKTLTAPFVRPGGKAKPL